MRFSREGDEGLYHRYGTRGRVWTDAVVKSRVINRLLLNLAGWFATDVGTAERDIFNVFV